LKKGRARGGRYKGEERYRIGGKVQGRSVRNEKYKKQEPGKKGTQNEELKRKDKMKEEQEKEGTGGKVQGRSARDEGYRRKGTRTEC
jgi:hypothetical protein